MRNQASYALIVALACIATPVRAEFIINQAIVEFTSTSGAQQDIDIISRSESNDYLVAEVYEVHNPGAENEQKQLVDDPAKSGLIVTPDKTILAGGSRQVLRFVLVDALSDRERIFRVALKPVVNDIAGSGKMGLKVLIGYEVLVIVRPATITSQISAVRQGKTLTITNQGNSNVLLQAGQQCAASNPSDCKPTSAARIYPQQHAAIDLPFDAPISINLWDGLAMKQQDLR